MGCGAVVRDFPGGVLFDGGAGAVGIGVGVGWGAAFTQLGLHCKMSSGNCTTGEG